MDGDPVDDKLNKRLNSEIQNPHDIHQKMMDLLKQIERKVDLYQSVFSEDSLEEASINIEDNDFTSKGPLSSMSHPVAGSKAEDKELFAEDVFIHELDLLMDSVCEYIENNRDTYFICKEMGNVLHISKKVNLTISEFNNNSVFQPYESKEEKACIVSFLLLISPSGIYVEDEEALLDKHYPLSERDDEYIDRFRRVGCETYTVGKIGNIQRILEGVKK